jgi:hypothetical protein
VTQRIGLIQTRGLGDIIIALPIADHFIEKGDSVFWPVDASFLPSLQRIKPEINFIGVPCGTGVEYFYDTPLRYLREADCSRVISLYSYVTGLKINVDYLTASLKFDEYKYAVARVPFARKWDLALKRDPGREMALHTSLRITKPYICIHSRGSNYEISLNLSADLENQFQVVRISELTDSVFDWIYTLEHAAKLLLIDSCFSNLVEQLGIQVEKYLMLRSPACDTPVYRNNWVFLGGK